MSIKRITPGRLQELLRATPTPLLLDARRAEALRRRPIGIPSAMPVILDEPELRIPGLAMSRPVIVYCLCSGAASSTRVALRLASAGHNDVSVLQGGLPAWEAAGLPVSLIEPVTGASSTTLVPAQAAAPARGADPSHLIAERTFLLGQELPVKRDMAVLFVDMVDSTQLVFSRSPEEVLRLVQAFMACVVDVAVTHCGDVHDFQGDGAMLYFAGVGEALPAAFDLLADLEARRRVLPELPQARIALDTGPLVVGHVGTAARRSLSFIGASVNTAGRILKLAPPDGVVATERVIAEGRRTDPDLAAHFVALPERQQLKGIAAPVTVYLARHSDCCRAEAHHRRGRE